MTENIKKIEDKTDEILNNMYLSYASGYGVLFGLSPDLKRTVRLIIRLTIQYIELEKKIGDSMITQTELENMKNKINDIEYHLDNFEDKVREVLTNDDLIEFNKIWSKIYDINIEEE